MSSSVEESKENSETEEIEEVKEPVQTSLKVKELEGQKPVILERRLPRINCEEHIIFVFDVCKEEGSTSFQLSEGSYTLLFLLKRALIIYLHNKKAINPNHKYALMLLHESPIWLVDFTSNPRDIINELENIKESPSSSKCDLSEIFDLIQNQVTLPCDTGSVSVSPPPFVVRTIMLYGRSQCLPEFLCGKESFLSLTQNPHFFLDILYAHELPSEENKCEAIFDLLCDLDHSGWSYIFEVGRNATKFHNLCSMLVAHPLQRPAQKDAHYTLMAKEG